MIYFECNQNDVITAFSRLLNSVINNVYIHEEQYLLDEEEFETVNNLHDTMPKIAAKKGNFFSI